MVPIGGGRWGNCCDAGPGVWTGKAEPAKASTPSTPETVHDSREEAIRAAEWMLRHHAGGVLTVLGEDGAVVSREAFRCPGSSPAQGTRDDQQS
ncbi:MAG: DUF2188 domain-containing protein [Phycisphaerales bacterium]